MATIVFAAAGAAVGSAVGGAVLGVSAAVIGQAVGATIGASIDARVMGGSARVETGRLDTMRVQGAGEGTDIPYMAGRARLPGQIIWSTRFKETVTTSKTRVGNAKNGTSVRTTSFSYSVSLGLALCEGEVQRIGRIWADGKRLSKVGLTYRLHSGSEEQEPDPLIEAVEGDAPAYRGLAYIVFEDLELEQFGNRIPQISVEVFRKAQSRLPQTDALFAETAQDMLEAVALIPGTGEYTLATEPVRLVYSPGAFDVMNVNTETGDTDFIQSLEQLDAELPNVTSGLLVVSWFGDDLRAGQCSLRPKVEQNEFDGAPIPWQVAGEGRAEAAAVSQFAGRVNFGGTPADRAVIQAIQRMNADGIKVTFYPFILMDVPPGNALPDPYGKAEQARFPWRGRITTELAPDQPGTTDKTPAAALDVAAFMGVALPTDFAIIDGLPVYQGPVDWGFRRMILHYAHLCAAAGGVEAFCIGSELRALTQIRDGQGSYPFVSALKALAQDVRSILGPTTKIGYAADWSEYFGHHPSDGSGDVFYHLDPLWADPNIDFVGIDNYFPVSDWRDDEGHADSAYGSIYNLEYLRANVQGGEGYDWFYASSADRANQVRTPIVDAAHGEDHVFRPKDLTSWWRRAHFNRPGGVREVAETGWVPEAKPIWFTEFGCPAIDKGTNQPNVFVDELSSESAEPYFSSGARDDFIQRRYIEAVLGYWREPENNPESYLYDGSMVEVSRAHVWAWDARPTPEFPSRVSVWSDGPNYARGHWVSGRVTAVSIAEVVAELAGRAGFADIDVQEAYGGVQGVEVRTRRSTRAALQPLLLGAGVDAFDAGDVLAFRSRSGRVDVDLSDLDLAMRSGETLFERARDAEPVEPPRIRVEHFSSDRSYQTGTADAAPAQSVSASVEEITLPLVISGADARQVAERILVEREAGVERITLGMGPDRLDVGAGDVVAYEGARYRVDRIDLTEARVLEGVQIDPAAYARRPFPEDVFDEGPVRRVGPVETTFLDLPLMRGDEVEHAPHLAAASEPWPGSVAVLDGADAGSLSLNRQIDIPSVMGRTETDLPPARPDLWQRGATLDIRLVRGALETRNAGDVLAGANLAALRSDGGDWEMIQFRAATLIAPGLWRLTDFLRGQFGTEFVHEGLLPAGAEFVLMDGAPEQIDLALSVRGLPRLYRIGPSDRPADDPTFVEREEVFSGVGLRPYAPVHLRTRRLPDGSVALNWIRRTRIEGDVWEGGDVPVAEEREAYRVRLIASDGSVTEHSVTEPNLTLAPAQVPAGPLTLAVAQISARWGAGPEIFGDLP
ncbi:MAG: glycoside hydrolase/phage tail family protein [Pseudomonadota bacterium]